MKKIDLFDKKGEVIFSFEKEGNTVRDTLEEAIRRKVQLIGLKIEKEDLRGAILTYAEFPDCHFSYVDLRGADIRESIFLNCLIWDTKMHGADMDKSLLIDTRIIRVGMKGISFNDAELDICIIENSDMKGASFYDTRLNNTEIVGCQLNGADIERASLNKIHDDFFSMLRAVPEEFVMLLREDLINGKTGATYHETGEEFSFIDYFSTKSGYSKEELFNPEVMYDRPAEYWAAGIDMYDTPETNPIVAITVKWINKYLNNTDAHA